jgi:hypothetical protein
VCHEDEHVLLIESWDFGCRVLLTNRSSSRHQSRPCRIVRLCGSVALPQLPSPRACSLEVVIWYTDVLEIPISNRVPKNPSTNAHDGRTKMLDRRPRRSVSNIRDRVGGGSVNIAVLSLKKLWSKHTLVNSNSDDTFGMKALFGIVRLMINGFAIFRWLLAIVCVAFPPIYLAYNPTDFTPLVDTLFSIFLFFLAYWIGTSKDSAVAAQQANDRWLPQAESVIFRLMTLRANVLRFANLSKQNCTEAECELPELKEENMRAVRIKMKTDCESANQRLLDIGCQLEDAIEDWRRFIIANCAGDECQRISEALQQRQQRLYSENIGGPEVDRMTGEN